MSQRIAVVCIVCIVAVFTVGSAVGQLQFSIVQNGTGQVVGQLGGDMTSVVPPDLAVNTLLTGPGPALPPNSAPVINAMIAGPTAPGKTVLAANVSCVGGCPAVTFQYCQRAQACNYVTFGMGIQDSTNASLYKATMTNIPLGVYYWRVVASDQSHKTTTYPAQGSTPGIFAVVNIPAAPTGVTVSTKHPVQGPIPGGFWITWPGASGAGGYSLKASTSPNGPFNVVQPPIDGYSTTLTTLTPNTTYYLVLSSLNGAGESANSAPVSALTPPAAPAGANQMPSQPGYLSLMWLPSPAATSYLLNLGGVIVNATSAAANCAGGMCMYGAGGFPSGTQTSCSVAAVNASGGQSAYSAAVYCAAQ